MADRRAARTPGGVTRWTSTTSARILDLVKEHDLSEFELEVDGLKIKVRKSGGAHVIQAPALAPYAPLPAVALPGGAARAARPSSPGRMRSRAVGGRRGPGDRQVADRRHVLPRAGARARRRLSRRATRVKKGQVLCIIEAMKLMNEIESDYDGEVVAIYVENGQPVQYGERLFAIKVDRDVQEDPDRQPRRDRAARHPGLPGAGHQDRRRLLGGRRELAARPVRRRGRLHRAAARRRTAT